MFDVSRNFIDPGFRFAFDHFRDFFLMCDPLLLLLLALLLFEQYHRLLLLLLVLLVVLETAPALKALLKVLIFLCSALYTGKTDDDDLSKNRISDASD